MKEQIHDAVRFHTMIMENKDKIMKEGKLLGETSLVARINHPELSIKDELTQIAREAIKTETHLLELLDTYINRIDFYHYMTITGLELELMDMRTLNKKILKEAFLNGWDDAISKAYKDTPKRGKTLSEIRETFIKNVENRVGTLVYDLTVKMRNDDIDKGILDYMVKDFAWRQFIDSI